MSPVRNIGGIGNSKPISVIHYIPPYFSPIWKIEVVTDTETIDVTELIVDGSYLDGVTSSIGDFEFKLLDPENTNSDRISEFDTVNIYLDYGIEATTLKFSGKIERKANQEQVYLVLSGRSIAMITTGINVTYTSDGPKARSVIFTELIEKYFSGTISTTGIEEDLTEIDVNYEETPFWNIVEELCISGGRDAYISPSSVFNYFVKGSRHNMTEAVVENVNLVEATDYSKDTQEVYTKVRVYGQQIDGIPIIATVNSGTTYTKGIVKELKIDNTSIITSDQAKELATAEAADKQIPPTIGSIISLILPTISPGESINIANPVNNIPPAAYQINSFRQMFYIDDTPKTELIIQKQRVELSTIIKSNIKFQSTVSDNQNPYDMDSSIVISFASDSGVHDNTVWEGKDYVNGTATAGEIKTVTGSTGTWISDLYQLDSDLAGITLRISGTDVVSTKLWISINGGATWQNYGIGSGSLPSGSALKIRADITESTTRINTIGVLYNIH